MTDLNYPARVEVSYVSRKYLDTVEKYNEKQFQVLGKFDTEYLVQFAEFADMISNGTSGEIELLYMPAPNKTGAAMLVACYEGEYVALAGLRDKERIFED